MADFDAKKLYHHAEKFLDAVQAEGMVSTQELDNIDTDAYLLGGAYISSSVLALNAVQHIRPIHNTLRTGLKLKAAWHKYRLNKLLYDDSSLAKDAEWPSTNEIAQMIRDTYKGIHELN